MYDTTTTILPNRPIYQMAQQYERVFPAVNAVGSILYTPGNRVEKLQAGSSTFVNMFTFQHINRAYTRAVKRFERSHPRFAEQMNLHPFLLGIPVASIGILLASIGGNFSEWTLGFLWGIASFRKNVSKALHTEPINKMAEFLKPAERFANKRIVKGGLAVAGLGFLGTWAVRSIQDRWNFSKQYAEARKLESYQEVSPFQLRRNIAQDLWQPSNS